MAAPDSSRNRSERAEIWAMVGADPTKKTISHEKTKTTTVRSAVATSESVFLMPHLAKIAVKPANTADKTAANSHIGIPSFMYILQNGAIQYGAASIFPSHLHQGSALTVARSGDTLNAKMKDDKRN